MWTTIYTCIHEQIKNILPNFKYSLLLYKRYIDGMFGFWTGDGATFEEFRKVTNNFGILTWEFDTPSRSVNSLDLTINISKDSRIATKTYQNDLNLNLYQYIMLSSNHAPRMMKGIIPSLVNNYKLQNSEEDDYLDMCKKLFVRHVTRGWDRTTMKTWILEADRRLRLPQVPATNPPAPTDNPSHLFLYMEYHKNNIPKRIVRSLYNTYCQPIFSKYPWGRAAHRCLLQVEEHQRACLQGQAPPSTWL